MNGLNRNVQYHNSVPSQALESGKDGIYKPSTTIKTEALTDKYTLKGDIGRGKFAVVKKCYNNETGDVVAAKFIRKRRRGKSCREEILREVVMLEMALEHPRLVDLKEVFETNSELILITEYCAGGELFTECVIEESFTETHVVKMMRQILDGLSYLHERNIVHLDLKPQNILFTEPFPAGDIKLCDLGFACLVNTGEDIRDIIGTPDYVAPEVLSYEPLGLYTDMWSLGVLTYVMLTAHSPFAGNSQQETFLNISQVNLDFPSSLFSNISSSAQDFICQLLVKEPSERLTAKQCLEHPWLSGVVSPSSDHKHLTGASNCEVENIGEEEHCDKQERVTEKRKMEVEETTGNKTEKGNIETNNGSARYTTESDLVGGIYRTHLEVIPTKIFKCNSSEEIVTGCSSESNGVQQNIEQSSVNVWCSDTQNNEQSGVNVWCSDSQRTDQSQQSITNTYSAKDCHGQAMDLDHTDHILNEKDLSHNI